MGIEGRELGNRYEILIKIGSGGMATVYKAKDKVLKRFVAIKILRDEFITDEEFIKKFEQEAQSAARLTHPNIVSIYDVGVEDNLNYIVMELIKGKTLKEIILEEKRPLPWKWSVNIAMQIASALDVAHRNNIIHRDIKPHNIIITEDGIAKVTDFGIAKAVSNSTITAFGKTMRSVHYFSPEHARGGVTDEKSDIYSLGVVLYEMVTGKLPFDSDTPVSVALKHMQDKPIEPRKINPKVPHAVNDIIMKALQKDANLRYQSADDMLEDLQIALRDPNGNFVEDIEYDPTAKTKIIDRNEINKYAKEQQILDGGDEEEEDDDEDEDYEEYEPTFFQRFKVPIIIVALIAVFGIAAFATKMYLGKEEVVQTKQVIVPNVVNRTLEDATKILEENNLKLVIESEEYSKDIPENSIISQSPSRTTYTKVDENSEVKVVVSKGTEKTKVPDVVGKTKDEAKKLIEDAGLKAEFVEENSKTVKEGLVISQEVAAQKEVDAGDTIKVIVSAGTGVIQVEMINVVGQTQSEATTNLEAMNLKVITQSSTDTSKANGIVLKQSVEVGTQIDEGTTITLTINKVDELKEVPVNIYVKELTGGSSDSNSTNTNTTTTSDNVTVTIKNGNTVEFTQGNVSMNQTTLVAKIKGRGEVTLEIEITDKQGNLITKRTVKENFNTVKSIDVK